MQHSRHLRGNFRRIYLGQTYRFRNNRRCDVYRVDDIRFQRCDTYKRHYLSDKHHSDNRTFYRRYTVGVAYSYLPRRRFSVCDFLCDIHSCGSATRRQPYCAEDSRKLNRSACGMDARCGYCGRRVWSTTSTARRSSLRTRRN